MKSLRTIVIIVLLCMLIVFMTVHSQAADSLGNLEVHVRTSTSNAPVPDATVCISDAAGTQPAQSRTSDKEGIARFTGLAAGEYTLEISHPDYEGDRLRVTITTGRTNLCSSVLSLKSDDKVIQVRDTRLLMNSQEPQGSRTTIDTTAFEERTGINTLTGIAGTIPGVQTESVGQFHPRGDEKGLSVNVDGVMIPFTSESQLSQIIDPRFLKSFGIQTGCFDTSAGGQLAAIETLTTLSGTGKPYCELVPTIGTYGTYGLMARAGGASESGDFNYFVGALRGETDNRIDPVAPNAQTLNNHGADSNVLVHFENRTKNDKLGLTVSYQDGAYGMPQQQGSFDAGVRQYQSESNILGVFSWKRQISDTSDFKLGLAYLRFQQKISNNGIFTPYVIAPDTLSEELAEDNLPLNPTNSGSPYLPTSTITCEQFQPSLEYSRRYTNENRIKLGLVGNMMATRQNMRIIDAGGGGGLPNPLELPAAPRLFIADVARNSFYGGAYFSHTFPLFPKKAYLNWGFRGDVWNDGWTVNSSMLSPRINLCFPLADTQALRFSYNQIFQVPPFEFNPVIGSVCRPERTTVWEASYEFQPSKTVLGKVALVYKNRRDRFEAEMMIPNSTIPLYAPVNFGTGYYKGAEVSLSTHNSTGWNGFLTTTVGEGRPLTFDPGITARPEYFDDDQRVQATAGISYSGKNGLVAGLDVLYGSGYPIEATSLYNQIGIFPYGLNGNRFSRTIANLSLSYLPKGPDGEPAKGLGGQIVVQNLFDDRSVINFLSEFSGTRFVQGRRILLNGFFRW
jgi:hypothetical protein